MTYSINSVHNCCSPHIHRPHLSDYSPPALCLRSGYAAVPFNHDSIVMLILENLVFHAIIVAEIFFIGMVFSLSVILNLDVIGYRILYQIQEIFLLQYLLSAVTFANTCPKAFGITLKQGSEYYNPCGHCSHNHE